MAKYGNNNKPKRISYTLGTLFSSEKNGAEYQFVKIGFYDSKMTLNFCKGKSGGASKMIESFVHFDYETSCALSNVLDSIIRDRVGAYRAGDPYKLFNCGYSIRYMDSDSNQLRTLGNLIIYSEQLADSGKNAVVIKYNDGKEEFKIMLSSPWIEDSFSFGEEDTFIKAEIDIFDQRLYAFAYLMSNIIKNWPVLVQQDILARYNLNRLTAIAEKLGIGYGNGNGGNYNDSNYRNNRGGNNNERQLPPAPEPEPASTGGDFPGDEPF